MAWLELVPWWFEIIVCKPCLLDQKSDRAYVDRKDRLSFEISSVIIVLVKLLCENKEYQKLEEWACEDRRMARPIFSMLEIVEFDLEWQQMRVQILKPLSTLSDLSSKPRLY